MKRLQAFKFLLRPNGQQQRQMRRFAGACRWVYNEALRLQIDRHAAGEKKLTYIGLCQQLTQWKREARTAWLCEPHSQILQQSLKDLDRAYKNFFEKRADFPTFKKFGRHDAFRFPQGIKLDEANSRIFLPKLGWLRYRNSRKVLGATKNVTVSLSGGRWYVAIHTEREVPEPVHPATSIVGIDLGVANFATLSTGEIIAPVNALKKRQRQLARAQRSLSRKQKFSRNWTKAKARIQKIHTKVACARQDFQHKASTAISKNHAIVVIEDLKVSNMSKSAAGTVAQPGRNVRAKAGLNRSILDQGWGEFRRQLEYKQAWRGGQVIAVSPMNTSRTCPACGHVAAENRVRQDRFKCVACGHTAHADINAAHNILAEGHYAIACGAGALAPAAKQEPTEATRPESPHEPQ